MKFSILSLMVSFCKYPEKVKQITGSRNSAARVKHLNEPVISYRRF